MTTYASTTPHMAIRLAFGATVAVGLAGLTCDMLGGVLIGLVAMLMMRESAPVRVGQPLEAL